MSNSIGTRLSQIVSVVRDGVCSTTSSFADVAPVATLIEVRMGGDSLCFRP